MKTIEVGGQSVDELLRAAGDENVILRTRDGREFVLAEVDDLASEIQLTRGNAELMELLDKRSSEAGKYSTDDVRRKLGIK